MADPISIISLLEGSISLIFQCGSVAKTLNDMIGKFNLAQLTIMSLIQEVETIEMAWSRIREWSQNHSEAASDIRFFERLNRSLECGALVLSALEQDLADYDGVSTDLTFRKRASLAWNERALLDHQHRVRGQVQAMSLLLLVLELPTSNDRHAVLQKEEQVLQQSDESAYSIVPSRRSSQIRYSRVSSSARNRDSHLSVDSTELVYRRLSFENDLFTAQVYKRNYRNSLINSLFRSGSRAKLQRNRSIGIRSSSSTRSDPEPGLSSLRPSRDSSLQRVSPTRSEPLLAEADSDEPCRSPESEVEQHMGILQSAQTADRGRTIPSFLPPTPIREEFSTPTSEQFAINDTSSRSDTLSPRSVWDKNYSPSYPRQSDEASTRPSSAGFRDVYNEVFDREKTEPNEDNDVIMTYGSQIVREIDDPTPFDQSGAHQSLQPEDEDTSTHLLDKQQALHTAVRLGNLSEVQGLLAQGAQVDNNDAFFGCSPLHSAVAAENIEMSHLLIQHGAQVDKEMQCGTQSLHLTAQKGNIALVKLLLAAGAACDCIDGVGRQPLHFVARYADAPEVVTAMASSGADVNAHDEVGWTPLKLARNAGHVTVVEALLRFGARDL